jgi:hypothetical protein
MAVASLSSWPKLMCSDQSVSGPIIDAVALDAALEWWAENAMASSSRSLIRRQPIHLGHPCLLESGGGGELGRPALLMWRRNALMRVASFAEAEMA